MPVRQLKNVVLPAPLGPMSPTISWSYTTKSTSETAVRPPNRLVTPRASRTTSRSAGTGHRPSRRRAQRVGLGVALPELALPSSTGHDALGPEPHHEDQRDAEQQESLVLEGPQLLRDD